jgi:DNA-binding NtrC family response regulator
MSRVLVIDDQDYVRESLSALLRRDGHDVRAAASAEAGLTDASRHPPDAVVTDLQLPGADGLAVVEQLGRAAPGIPVIVLTGHGSVSSAVACMKAGAFDYLEKPVNPDALGLVVRRALEWRDTRRELELLRLAAPETDDGAPAGESAAWRKAVDLAERAALADSPMIVLGESGSGKEVLARLVHARSSRRARPFVAVNCAAIPPELFESEFFGHVKGAFTGASADREGRFGLAHGGTLFLDEVACLTPAAQAKLLRVLQDGTYERVGDSRALTSDARVIAATNADLDALAAGGAFRKDLLYRLDVVRVRVPPLRERRDDIPRLAARLLGRVARRTRRTLSGISPEALRQLVSYDWPGNVRELENVLERAAILERTDVLSPASLPFGDGAAAPAPDEEPGDLRLREAALRAERQAITEALRVAGGNRSEAARLLGVDPRNLAYYLRKHGIREGS